MVIDRSRAFSKLSNEAIMQAAQMRFTGLAQIDVAEQPPRRNR
jgi:hypothetical protein